ncbi:Cytochrome P450 [Cordyceps fumosorosea ARSEF 2679]|uniref:Cytochrome P450 n=1 Tax=Cordyceps fumosorosea (strain ARSEF 2679) TaxID=1081104 RepID=A0A167Q5I8_CORFA|nr:Cytochrome P450 [Cordyceps fumosorosea ARSEF 2679]OAA57314.1 Cytochrome P450 [Cordyceps fumosorosea ARSEF 2679]
MSQFSNPTDPREWKTMAANNFVTTAQPVLQTLQQGLDDAVQAWRVEGLLSWPTVYLVATAVVTYWACLVGHRLFLHPLAGIPGPKFAALTYWYEIYYDVWLGGQYFRKVKQMHERYGPIVRINPDEVHFNDPDFIEPLYPSAKRKTNKSVMTGRRTGTPNSLAGTADHDTHRLRRGTISGFFSTASIRRLEPIMKADLRKLLARMHEAGETGEILKFHIVLKACACDIVTQYAFGTSFNFLGEKDFAAPYIEATDVFHFFNHAMCHFPIVGYLLGASPDWLIKAVFPGLTEMWNKKTMWYDEVEKIRNSPNPERIKSTIFEGVLSSRLPDEEKTSARLAHEAQLVVFAGQGTTAYTLSAAIYQLLAHPAELAKVKRELADALAGLAADEVPAYSQVETLPYLQAAIQETLRLHPGVVARLPRVSPTEPVVYQDKKSGSEYVIPAGTTYSMTAQIAHTNEAVFADPDSFIPQRWIDNPRLDRAFIGFARGTRNCIGMNFAKQELSIILATILHKYDLYRGQDGPTLELYDTTRERDIDCVRDMIIPFPAAGSPGLRLKIRN